MLTRVALNYEQTTEPLFLIDSSPLLRVCLDLISEFKRFRLERCNTHISCFQNEGILTTSISKEETHVRVVQLLHHSKVSVKTKRFARLIVRRCSIERQQITDFRCGLVTADVFILCESGLLVNE
jgi:hypothetical protein